MEQSSKLRAVSRQHGCYFLGPGQHERKTGPKTLAAYPWLHSALPEQAESESTTTYFGATGDLVPLNHFYMRKQRPRKVKHVPQAPPRVRVSQFLLRCWLLPPGTQQCGYFQYK